MAKQLPMTAPSAPMSGAGMIASQPRVNPVQSSHSATSGPVSGAAASSRNEAFSRGHTARVHTPAQAHHIAKTRGGNGA